MNSEAMATSWGVKSSPMTEVMLRQEETVVPLRLHDDEPASVLTTQRRPRLLPCQSSAPQHSSPANTHTAAPNKGSKLASSHPRSPHFSRAKQACVPPSLYLGGDRAVGVLHRDVELERVQHDALEVAENVTARRVLGARYVHLKMKGGGR